MENSVLVMTEQVVELAETFNEARDDGKIRLLEWVKLVRETSDVIKAAKEVKANDITELTESEIDIMASLVMSVVERETRVLEEDVADVLRMAQIGYRIAMRHRKQLS